MNTALKIDAASTIEFQGENISPADLAKSQWALIHDLKCRYEGTTVHGTDCKFEDDIWFATNSPSTSSRYGINWQLLGTKEPALQILAKTYVFDAILERGIEIGTAVQKFFALKKSLVPLILGKNLLTGNAGSLLVGLTHLTDDDFKLMIDTILVSKPSEQKAITTCIELAAFQTFANHIAEQIPMYRIRAQLPWKKSGETVIAWVKKRANDLNLAFPEVDGYEPLPTETIQPLVEKSLTLIDLYFDHFVAIAPLVAAHGKFVKYERKFVFELLQKYAPIFGPIKVAPDISKKVSTVEKAGLLFRWFREVLYLARGACVNVILLTTGLRNGDVRTLQADACTPSKRVDMLFHLRADIQKTGNALVIPVPAQTDKAYRLLEKIKFTESPYLLDASVFPRHDFGPITAEVKRDTGDDAEAWMKSGDTLNFMIQTFAAHFNIPFISPITGKPYTAHCYRTTVAGWLGSASNLSLLLVRRLFGHSNNVMPTVYLRNNPAFVAEREAQKARAHYETARQMGLAASQGRLAGIKGEQLERGFQGHKSRMHADRQKSHALTDTEILMTFNKILEQRIKSGSVCAFLTPFGVQCMRNLSDTSQPPCAKRANREKTQDIDPDLLKHVSDINPQQCIGTSCTEAVLGPWSTSVLETLNWYRAILSHQLGDAFTEEHFIASAKAFIQQYQEPLKKVFGIAALTNTVESSPNGEKVALINV